MAGTFPRPDVGSRRLTRAHRCLPVRVAIGEPVQHRPGALPPVCAAAYVGAKDELDRRLDDVAPLTLRQSLSVNGSEDGKVLANCFSGCEFSAIRDALGLDRGVNGRAGLQVAGSAPVQAEPVAPRVWKKLPAGPGVSRYDYRDEEGELVGVVIREDSGDVKGHTPQQPRN